MLNAHHERAAFEAWVSDWTALPLDGDIVYADPKTRIAWRAWRDRAAAAPQAPEVAPLVAALESCAALFSNIASYEDGHRYTATLGAKFAREAIAAAQPQMSLDGVKDIPL
jgi:hypothetical protein